MTPPTESRSELLHVVLRYALFQLPELAIAAIVLLVLVRLDLLSPTWGWILLGLWLFKELALFPFVRRAYEHADASATSSLIGKSAVVTERLDLQGTVRIGPELWWARLPPGAEPVEEGAQVCVTAVEGLTLHVDPLGPSLRTPGPSLRER